MPMDYVLVLESKNSLRMNGKCPFQLCSPNLRAFKVTNFAKDNPFSWIKDSCIMTEKTNK